MTKIGTLVDGALATVDASGQITSENFGALRWWVAADDRWHTPPEEPTCRQTRLEGTPVVETAIRVPSGDVVHRAYAVVDLGGMVVVEVENRSTLPVAVAFDRADVLTSRPPTAVPIEGITLPEGSIVVPVGKTSIVRVALGRGAGLLPPLLASADEVMRGWLGMVDRAPRLVLPDDNVRITVLRERSDLLVGALPKVDIDPAGYLLAASEMVRCGQAGDPLVDDVVVAAIAIAKASKSHVTMRAIAALQRAEEVLYRADQSRAAADVARMRNKLGTPVSDAAGAPGMALLLDGLACLQNGELVLLGDQVPRAWWGQPLEVHDAPVGDGTVSFAVRWHGERPALLWESTHDGVVRCPGLDPVWRGHGAKGEALLAQPT